MWKLNINTITDNNRRIHLVAEGTDTVRSLIKEDAQEKSELFLKTASAEDKARALRYLQENKGSNKSIKLVKEAIKAESSNEAETIKDKDEEFALRIGAIRYEGEMCLAAEGTEGMLEFVARTTQEESLEILEKTSQGNKNAILQFLVVLGVSPRSIDLLLEVQANIEAKDSLGFAPLHLAAREGHQEMINHLLEARANIEARSPKDETALHIAARWGLKESVEPLLKERADVGSTSNLDRWTALHHAALAEKGSRYQDTIKCLLENRANIEDVTDRGCTALHFAAACDTKEVVECLLENKANIEATECEGYTPLHFAALSKSREITKYLLEKRANIKAKPPVSTTLDEAQSIQNLFEFLRSIHKDTGIHTSLSDSRDVVNLDLAGDQLDHQLGT